MTGGGYIALVGDSIFDNATYVPGEPAVIDQLIRALPQGWQATLLAVDGATTTDIRHQLAELPPDITHIFVSAGGNDVLGESRILETRVASVAEAEDLLAEAQDRFRQSYESMANAVLASERHVAFCTVYEAIPALSAGIRVALTAFNDVILRAAFRAHAPVIDLRMVCVDDADYSSASPIEPSARGGEKIAWVVAHVATSHDFASGLSVVYP